MLNAVKKFAKVVVRLFLDPIFQLVETGCFMAAAPSLKTAGKFVLSAAKVGLIWGAIPALIQGSVMPMVAIALDEIMVIGLLTLVYRILFGSEFVASVGFAGTEFRARLTAWVNA